MIRDPKQELMLNLLYPAVLGAVLYSTLAAIFTPLVAQWTRNAGGPDVPEMGDAFVAEKGALLAVTFFFYLSDYFYVKYTNVYRWRFFFYSCLFLVGLYVTVAAIQMTRNVPPNASIVAGTYLFFMILYLLWDLDEAYHAPARERSFYRFVLIWEVASIAVLALTVRRLGPNSESAGLLALLTVITVAFVVVSFWKGRLWRGRTMSLSAA